LCILVLYREGSLVERGDDGRYKLRYFWLFSDCIVSATRSMGPNVLSRMSMFSAAATGKLVSLEFKPYRFRRLIKIAEMSLCDLPHGISSKNCILGDPAFAFCLACASGPSFVALVPNNPTDCWTKSGPVGSCLNLHKCCSACLLLDKNG